MYDSDKRRKPKATAEDDQGRFVYVKKYSFLPQFYSSLNVRHPSKPLADRLASPYLDWGCVDGETSDEPGRIRFGEEVDQVGEKKSPMLFCWLLCKEEGCVD